MMHRYCFEAFDHTMRDLMRGVDDENLNRPFGGKVVILGGDVRQILPVIRQVHDQLFSFLAQLQGFEAHKENEISG